MFGLLTDLAYGRAWVVDVAFLFAGYYGGGLVAGPPSEAGTPKQPRGRTGLREETATEKA